MFEADIDNAFENKYLAKEELPEEGAVALAGKKTQETLTATDIIIDALDVAEVEQRRIAEYEVYDFSSVAAFIIYDFSIKKRSIGRRNGFCFCFLLFLRTPGCA